jgi:hypothetical protein
MSLSRGRKQRWQRRVGSPPSENGQHRGENQNRNQREDLSASDDSNRGVETIRWRFEPTLGLRHWSGMTFLRIVIPLYLFV